MPETSTIRLPDLSSRPHSLAVARDMEASPGTLYDAWTRRFDHWFADPGSLLMKAEVNSVFYFETVFQAQGQETAQRHPHYGRFLRLERDRLIEMTWVTGAPGTKGAETVVTIELAPRGTGTHLSLSHAGFADEESRDGHEEAWPLVLDLLDERTR